jgi:DNA-binding LacI/PurR family transcriptional regulator
VRDTADRLGYRPSAAARTLRTGRSGVIGLIITVCATDQFAHTDIAYFAQLIQSATTTALSHGYGLVILPTGGEHEWASVLVDGAIVLDPEPTDPVLAELRRRGVPVVTDGREPDPALVGTSGGGCVDHDRVGGIRTVLDHMAAAGAHRIGLIGGTGNDPYTRECMAAYSGWCQSRGQAPIVECFQAPSIRDGALAAKRILTRQPRPDAVFGIYDACGSDLLAAARSANLRVPDDVLIACCSESDAYAAVDPPVTTLSLNPRACAATAVSLLVDAIEERAPRAVSRTLPTELVTRESTRPHRADAG